MTRREAADAIAIEGIKNEHDDGQINKSENKSGIYGEKRGATVWRLSAHLKDHRFSRRSVRKSKEIVMSKMQMEMAEPKGQSNAAPKRLCTTLAIIVPEAPPTSNGARKSPSERTKANVAPASSPGVDKGRMTRRNVCAEPAPRSCDASTRGRGMCSRDA